MLRDFSKKLNGNPPDELEKGLKIALTGERRDAALEAFQRHIQEWNVALPPFEPIVLDFGLGEYEQTGLIEYWISNEKQAGYCGKYLFVFDGQACPAHQHQKKHETFFMVKGNVRMTVDGHCEILSEGDVLPVPPGRLHTFTGVGPALLLELSTPCEIIDNQFADKRIPIGKKEAE